MIGPLMALVDAVIRQQAVAPVTMSTASFAEALEVFHASRYTGRIYIDFAEGKPKAVHLPNPLCVKMVEPG